MNAQASLQSSHFFLGLLDPGADVSVFLLMLAFLFIFLPIYPLWDIRGPSHNVFHSDTPIACTHNGQKKASIHPYIMDIPFVIRGCNVLSELHAYVERKFILRSSTGPHILPLKWKTEVQFGSNNGPYLNINCQPW